MGPEKRTHRDIEIAIFQHGAAIVFLWLLTCFWQLQVRNPEIYEERAAQNSVKSLPILAPRGKILDRDGRVLVNNVHTFKLMVSRKGANAEHAAVIADGLNLDRDRLALRLRELSRSNGPEYQRVVIKDNLTDSEVAFLEAHQNELPELELIRTQQRRYPRAGLAAHLIGYVGEISERELKKDEFILFDPGAEVGKAGVERQYNAPLTGSDGSRLVLVDSLSRRVRDLDVVEATPGRTLRLTIDLDLQVVAELAMENRRGSVVARDPRNGEILAMVSRPAFDPNEFVGGLSAGAWRRMLSHPDKPIFHRALQARLAPGSIFKPFVAWAALATRTIDADFQAFCSGGGSFYGRYFRCHKPSGHGWVNVEQALVHSCDVFFYTVGKELGIDRIAEYARMSGFGARTGIDLPHEEPGLVPSSTWKVRLFRDRWWPGETISVVIGQGALEVTPLQAAYAIGGLAMGGEWRQPHLIAHDEIREIDPRYQPPEPRRIEIHPRHLRTIVKGLWGVVNEGGTGVRAALPRHDVCGKTGTAQRVSRDFAATSDDPRLKDDGWFVAFAPCKAPEIAIAVLFENGEHGAWAAPIARDVIKAYFDKKERRKWLQARQDPAVPPQSPATEEAAAR